jgi:hypothetical protein
VLLLIRLVSKELNSPSDMIQFNWYFASKQIIKSRISALTTIRLFEFLLLISNRLNHVRIDMSLDHLTTVSKMFV